MILLVMSLKTSARVCGKAYSDISEVLVGIKMEQVKASMVIYRKNKISGLLSMMNLISESWMMEKMMNMDQRAIEIEYNQVRSKAKYTCQSVSMLSRA